MIDRWCLSRDAIRPLRCATGIAKILFILFLVLFVASFLFGRMRGPR